MEIKTILDTLGIPVSTTIVVLLLSLIKIPKIELNLWGMLGKALSKGINGPVLDKIETIENKLDAHIKESEAERALNDRHKILRFADEISSQINHSKEHYEETLFSIDKYEEYCNDNPDFPNSKCLSAIEVIKSSYKDKLENGGFLGGK